MDVKITLKGQQMYDFLNSFARRVRPPPSTRIPQVGHASASDKSTSMMSGVGSDRKCWSCSPDRRQPDSYAKMHGFYVHFVTTARENDAQNRARALMSGIQIPFIRK